ncbi:MAG TPA: HD domain-containing phosphohydrolase [Pyrinomonadaceae bacterium]|nr:HD domain-containing phosphohydrolase [Pyrinomonadaceae bacterium]
MEQGAPLQKLLHSFGALADLGQEIAESSDFQEKMRTALHLVQGSLGLMRGALAEFDAERRELNFVAARGVGAENPAPLALSPEEVSDLIRLGTRGLTKDDENPAAARFVERHEALLDALRVDMVVPLVVREKLVGLMLLGGKATGESFTAEDREVISTMARHIAVGMQEHNLFVELSRRAEENRQLYDEMRVIYHDTVRAFAAAIDCKDKYTQGHSERVGRYSEIIAREMGWSDDEVEGIAVAGYLHDVGKLVVERDIINAPYKIDAKQSSELNRHPAAGYEILAPINHPYADIPLSARYHHERIDGRGYPEGLKGDEIPLAAKIVSVADAFDAMTTDRPYKRRRDLVSVIDDLRRNSGKQFAPEVVACICRALLKEINGDTRQPRIIRMLGRDYVEREQVAPLLQSLIEDIESGTLSATAGNS